VSNVYIIAGLIPGHVLEYQISWFTQPYCTRALFIRYRTSHV